MQIVYAKQPFPERWTGSIFLAGPTPRSPEVPSWRPQALELLRERGFGGAVFVPEDAGGVFQGSYIDQVEWEAAGLALADVVLFWVPRELRTMPAFTTNVEFGHWIGSGKAAVGLPEGAPKNRYLAWLAGRHRTAVHATMEATIDAALARIGPGAERAGGERYVPLRLWRVPSFQSWYRALRAAGNRLDGAELLWSHTPKHMSHPFAWILEVKVWVAAEGRYKKNEWVLARSDISAALLRGPAAPDPLDTEIALIREYRAPARTLDGFVRELPGGSGEAASARELAAEEVHEETGLRLAPERLRPAGSRQLAGTLSAHTAQLFVAELTAEEMATLEETARSGVAHGIGGERTYVEIWTPRRLLAEPGVDWSTVGMVLSAIR